MDMAEDGRVRLGEAMAERRRELGLSVTRAAAAARIDRTTWSTTESGVRLIATYNRAGVERALGWEAGSIDAVLAGGEPLLAKPAVSQPNADRLAAEIERIKGLPLPADDRLTMVRALIDLYAEAAGTDSGDRPGLAS